MGWFSHDKKEEKQPNAAPSLPELPKLPDFPKVAEDKKEENSLEPLHQLPSFPSSSFGEKISQNTIKDAVSGSLDSEDEFKSSGEKEVKEDLIADDFAEDELQKMQKKPLRTSRIKELPLKGHDDKLSFAKARVEVGEEFRKAKQLVKSTEPVFIRLDKFEESLHLFQKTQKEVEEVEEMLKDIKALKEEEDKELKHWEIKLQNLKNQVEKVNQDIFARIE